MPEGPAPAPVTQRLRVRYAKRGRLRFTSHRDISRAVERAVRRAGIPVAFSAGFTPHPKISYAGAAATGVASEAEYLELGLTETRDPARVRADLDAALPPGLDVLDVVPVRAGRGDAPVKPGAFTDRLEASEWRIRLDGVAESDAAAAVAAFMAPRTSRWNASRRRDGAVSTCAPPCPPASWTGVPPRRRMPLVRYFEWLFGIPHPPFDPTTSSPDCARSPTSRRRHRRW